MKFTIRTNNNLEYDKTPGGSYADMEEFIYDLKETSITKIERESENALRVDIKTTAGAERHGWIRTKSKIGKMEMDAIESEKQVFIGRSYDELINHEFSREK